MSYMILWFIRLSSLPASFRVEGSFVLNTSVGGRWFVGRSVLTQSGRCSDILILPSSACACIYSSKKYLSVLFEWESTKLLHNKIFLGRFSFSHVAENVPKKAPKCVLSLISHAFSLLLHLLFILQWSYRIPAKKQSTICSLNILLWASFLSSLHNVILRFVCSCKESNSVAVWGDMTLS